MDFVGYIRCLKEKLISSNNIDELWLALHNHEIPDPEIIDDFNHHLPLDLENFWKLALEKLNEPLDEVDTNLKKYLLVLLNQSITQCPDLVSPNSIIYAAEVYLTLLLNPKMSDIFNSKVYRNVLALLQSSIDNPNLQNVNREFIHKLRLFLSTSNLKEEDLENTLVTLIKLMFDTTRNIYANFASEEPGDVSYEALLSLKKLLGNETIPAKKFLITTYLFIGLRKYTLSNLRPQSLQIIQTNLQHLYKDLHHKFKEDHYSTFLNAFIHVWQYPDLIYFEEAVTIMNSLKGKHYRNLINILNKMLMSKTPHVNLFKLSATIICNPPSFSSVEKTKVTNELLLKNMLLNCLASKTDVSNSAIEGLSDVFKLELQNEVVKNPAEAIFNAKDDLDVPTILRGLQTLMSRKWTNRSRNKHLLVISLTIILCSNTEYPQIYHEVLEVITEEASPFDLKPFLPLLSETYLSITSRKFNATSNQLLKVIYKLAMHPMASSTEFVKYLYMAMVFPSVCKDITIKSESFIDAIISDEYNFVEFFQKCHTLGLIRKDHIAKILGSSLYTINESNLKLICAIVHLSDYKELSVISDHIEENYETICNNVNLNYFFYIYNQILKSTSRGQNPVGSNEIMESFIREHLLKQKFRWNCVANAFSLFININPMDLNEEFALLKQEYDEKLASSIRSNGSILPLVYFSQLIMFGKVAPTGANIADVINLLQLCSDENHTRTPHFNPKLWIGCLQLYTNLCIIKPNLVESGLNFLHNALNSTVNIVKLAAINLAFDLCNMVTHNFEDLIGFMFKEVVYGDTVFKKTCLTKIDRLIRDDYLKLNQQQYLTFVSILGDRNASLSDFMKKLMMESFFMSNTTLIAKFFVPLIVHINCYKRHPIYTLNNRETQIMQSISRLSLDRRKMYDLLMRNLSIKDRFNVVYTISVNIFDQMMKTLIKLDTGFWKMLQDSIFVFKLLTISKDSEESGDNYYKKVCNQITKCLLNKHNSDEQLYQQQQKEIVHSTLSLLKLLFFNDSESVQKHIRISIFDAIMHWTDFLMTDLIHIIHVDRGKEIQVYYKKVENFYKKNAESLRYTEESFERETSDNSLDISTGSLFNGTQHYIPNIFD